MDRYSKELKIELTKFNKEKKSELKFDCDLSLYSTMRLNSSGDLFIIKSQKDLSFLLKILSRFKQGYNVLGFGANILLPEVSDLPYIQIKFDFNKDYLLEAKDRYIFPASITLSILSSHASKFNLVGWEVFTGIPASLGGAVFMNAGTNLGEIGKLISKVTIMDKDSVVREEEISTESFSYRSNHFCKEGDIILFVEMKNLGIQADIALIIKKYLTLRNNSQPLKAFTCGCVFKNDEKCGAGQLIDLLRLKGLRVGGIKVSHKHANFMENTGNGTKSDVIRLIKIIQKEVKLNFNIELKTEVIHLT